MLFFNKAKCIDGWLDGYSSVTCFLILFFRLNITKHQKNLPSSNPQNIAGLACFGLTIFYCKVLYIYAQYVDQRKGLTL